MSTECTHTLSSGHKCHAPALDGGSLCRHHDPRKRAEAAHQRQSEFIFPEFHDSRSLLQAINSVLRAMSLRQIKRREAATFIFGIQLASRIVRDIKEQAPPFMQASLPDLSAPPALSQADQRLLKVAAERGVEEAAKQLIEESREPGDNSPVTEDDFEEAVEIITVLQNTGDRRQVIALMDARMEAYEQNLQASIRAGSLPGTAIQNGQFIGA